MDSGANSRNKKMCPSTFSSIQRFHLNHVAGHSTRRPFRHRHVWMQFPVMLHERLPLDVLAAARGHLAQMRGHLQRTVFRFRIAFVPLDVLLQFVVAGQRQAAPIAQKLAVLQRWVLLMPMGAHVQAIRERLVARWLVARIRQWTTVCDSGGGRSFWIGLSEAIASEKMGKS